MSPAQQQDPASLSRLHDIVEPPPISFWPPSPGWWVLLGVLLAIGFMLAWNANQRRRRNAYRHVALRELAAIDQKNLSVLPALLKRTALAGYPRKRVASLSGEAWLRFLDETGKTTEFTSGPGHPVISLAYQRDGLEADQVAALLDAAKKWIRSHATGATGMTGVRA